MTVIQRGKSRLICTYVGRVEISAQNHNYAVDPAALDDDVEVTHINLNDGTCAGALYMLLCRALVTFSRTSESHRPTFVQAAAGRKLAILICSLCQLHCRILRSSLAHI